MYRYISPTQRQCKRVPFNCNINMRKYCSSRSFDLFSPCFCPQLLYGSSKDSEGLLDQCHSLFLWLHAGVYPGSLSLDRLDRAQGMGPFCKDCDRPSFIDSQQGVWDEKSLETKRTRWFHRYAARQGFDFYEWFCFACESRWLGFKGYFDGNVKGGSGPTTLEEMSVLRELNLL